jgi:hypothetical protein
MPYKKILWTVALSIPSAVFSVVLREVFQAWGIFNPFSQWIGGWLKMHVTPAQTEWTIASVVALFAYAGLSWIVWRHHRVGADLDVRDASRYMTAYEVIHYLVEDSEWGKETRQHIGTDGMRKNRLFEAPVEFKRVAEQGRIHAVGRLNGVGEHIEIPETYWLSAVINPFSRQNRDISETIPAVPNPNGIPIYKNVRILRADAERAWPRAKK